MQRDIEEKFLVAYDDHADAIYRHCFFRVFSEGRAEELTQEVFMRAWEYLASGKDVQNIRAFLYRIATNLIIDESRKKKEESLDQLLETSDALEPIHDGHKDMEKNFLMKDVVAKIKSLPQEESQLLIMRYIDDLEPKEIAEILGVSANNVSVRINRAVSSLKASFHP